MRLDRIALVAVLLASCPAAAAAQIGVPSSENSSVSPCLVACPLGDIAFDVIVVDLAGLALSGSSVVLDFSACPEAFLCTVPGMSPDPYVVDLGGRTISMITDSYGHARFPLRVGGVCALATVRVFADGVQLATRALASPDQTGNGMVVGVIDTDYEVFATKLGTSDPTADFNCDGYVDEIDQHEHFNFHGSHSCQGFVDPAKRSSWGKVKSYYR